MGPGGRRSRLFYVLENTVMWLRLGRGRTWGARERIHSVFRRPGPDLLGLAPAVA